LHSFLSKRFVLEDVILAAWEKNTRTTVPGGKYEADFNTVKIIPN